jgi:hypothetical protein
MASVFEQIVQAVHEEISDAALPYGVFRLAQHEHGPLRRAVWIPTTYRTASVRMSNPVRGSDGVVQTAVYEESWDVECHITGASFEDAEQIRERILLAVRQLLHTSSQPNGGFWVNQDGDAADVMFGSSQKVVQRFMWSINVLEPPALQVDSVAVDVAMALQHPEADGPSDELVMHLDDVSVEPDA